MRLLSSLNHDEDERMIYQLGHHLIKNGHTSIIITSAGLDNKFARHLERDGHIYYQLGMHKKSWWSLLEVLRLRKYIKKHQPDIIHIHSRTPAWVLFWALKGIRLKKMPKTIATVYGFYPINNYSWASLHADALITVSDSVSNYLHNRLEQKSQNNNMVRIYRGVDTRRYTYRHNPSVLWLHKIFTEFPELEHKKWLVFPTIIGEEYGQEWLIDILGNLQEEFPNIHIIIMDGDHEYADIVYEDFRQRVFTLGLDKQITFVGTKRNDMRDWLSAANLVLALANEPESIGMPILQALHLGTPVVSWDRAAYSEILEVMYPQGLIREKNALCMCKVIKEQLNHSLRPPISNEFTFKQTVNATLHLYQLVNDEQPIPEQLS